MRSTAASVRTAVVALLLLVAGCGLFGGEDEKTFTLQLDASTVNVPQGSRDSVIVTLVRSGFDGPVELSIEGSLPSGVSVTYVPRTIPAGSTTSRVRFIATGAANPGTFTVTLRATGEGVPDKAVEIEGAVTLTGTFTLGTLAPLTVAQGGGGDATILLNRSGGNASSVDLSVSGLPSGMTATFAQTPSTDRAATLVVAAAAGVPTGDHTLTVTGAAAGITTNPTTTLMVNVIAAPATAVVSIPFCSTQIPTWFAYQNQGFPWQRVTPTGNAFNFAATDRVAIAMVFQAGSSAETNVMFFTRTELLRMNQRDDCAGPKTLTGTATGLTAGQSAIVALGAADFGIASATSGNYTMNGVASRPLDLVASRGVISSEGYFTADKLIVRRALDLTSTIPALDFASGEAFNPVTSNLTVTGFVSGNVILYRNNFWTTTNTYGILGVTEVPGGATTFLSMPGAQLGAGDKHELIIDSGTGVQQQVGHSSVVYFTTPGDRTETLGPLLSSPNVSIAASTPYARLRGQLPSQPEYGTAVRFVFFQAVTGGEKYLVLWGSAGHFGGLPTTWDIITPDLSGVTGFQSQWMPAMGQSTPFSAEAFTGSYEVLFFANPAAGESFKVGYRVIQTFSTLLRAESTGLRPRRPTQLGQYLRR